MTSKTSTISKFANHLCKKQSNLDLNTEKKKREKKKGKKPKKVDSQPSSGTTHLIKHETKHGNILV